MTHLPLRQKRGRMCRRKTRLTRVEAERLAASLRRQDGALMRAYRCHFCRGWHVGHIRKGQR